MSLKQLLVWERWVELTFQGQRIEWGASNCLGSTHRTTRGPVFSVTISSTRAGKRNEKEEEKDGFLQISVPQRKERKWSCSVVSDSLRPGSSIHGILQARILEWVAIPFSRASSRPRDQTQVSHIVGRCFTLWATRESCIPQRKLLSSWNPNSETHFPRHNSIQAPYVQGKRCNLSQVCCPTLRDGCFLSCWPQSFRRPNP